MPVYKDKKRGSWYVSFSYKDPLTNTYKKRLKRGFTSQKDAKQWERENYNVESYVGRSYTFREIAEKWEDSIQASNVTLSKHKEHLQFRFRLLTDKPIDKISKTDLIEWRSELAKSDYSTRTKNATISFVKSVFRFGTEMYDIPNTASILKNLKQSDDELLHEMNVWTPEEFNKFISCIDTPVYRVFFEFLYWTGCRRGEAVALQKTDVTDGWVNIRYSQRSNKEGLKPTKTKQKRKIQLDHLLLRDITPYLSTPGPYLFGGETGLGPTTIDRYFKEGIKKSGVKPIRIHDLRHSHATWLINNGVNIVAVSKRLGHATVEQTLKTYTHLLESSDQAMMSKINAYRDTKTDTKLYSIKETRKSVVFTNQQFTIPKNVSNNIHSNSVIRTNDDEGS